jgi:hypothetical protein
MILFDRLCADPTLGPTMKLAPGGIVPLRVHQDVVKLADDLATRDGAKLRHSAKHLFMPAEECWFEWPMAGEGDMGIMFLGARSVSKGPAIFYAWRHKGEDEGPTSLPLYFDLEQGIMRIDYEMFAAIDKMTGKNQARDMIAFNQSLELLKPVVFAFLALINSPKIVRRDPARVERLNRKRKAVGRYTFHPHHVVRLNVDRKTVRVGASDGGDGASRALHFVRAHLRLWEGRYILVQPHWRGDPQIGIVKPGYEIDRQTSTWRD